MKPSLVCMDGRKELDAEELVGILTRHTQKGIPIDVGQWADLFDRFSLTREQIRRCMALVYAAIHDSGVPKEQGEYLMLNDYLDSRLRHTHNLVVDKNRFTLVKKIDRR